MRDRFVLGLVWEVNTDNLPALAGFELLIMKF